MEEEAPVFRGKRHDFRIRSSHLLRILLWLVTCYDFPLRKVCTIFYSDVPFLYGRNLLRPLKGAMNRAPTIYFYRAE
jgi:hypothetical protein